MVSICRFGIGARVHALRQKHGPGWLFMDLDRHASRPPVLEIWRHRPERLTNADDRASIVEAESRSTAQRLLRSVNRHRVVSMECQGRGQAGGQTGGQVEGLRPDVLLRLGFALPCRVAAAVLLAGSRRPEAIVFEFTRRKAELIERAFIRLVRTRALAWIYMTGHGEAGCAVLNS